MINMPCVFQSIISVFIRNFCNIKFGIVKFHYATPRLFILFYKNMYHRIVIVIYFLISYIEKLVWDKDITSSEKQDTLSYWGMVTILKIAKMFNIQSRLARKKIFKEAGVMNVRETSKLNEEARKNWFLNSNSFLMMNVALHWIDWLAKLDVGPLWK